MPDVLFLPKQIIVPHDASGPSLRYDISLFGPAKGGVKYSFKDRFSIEALSDQPI